MKGEYNIICMGRESSRWVVLNECEIVVGMVWFEATNRNALKDLKYLQLISLYPHFIFPRLLIVFIYLCIFMAKKIIYVSLFFVKVEVYLV